MQQGNKSNHRDISGKLYQAFKRPFKLRDEERVSDKILCLKMIDNKSLGLRVMFSVDNVKFFLTF